MMLDLLHIANVLANMLYKNTSGFGDKCTTRTSNVWAISSNVNTSITNMSGCYSVRRLAWFFFCTAIPSISFTVSRPCSCRPCCIAVVLSLLIFFHVGHSKALEKEQKSASSSSEHNSHFVRFAYDGRREIEIGQRCRMSVDNNALGSCGRVM